MNGHVTLGPLVPQDAPAITRAMRHWDMVRWLPEAHWPYGTDDALDLIRQASAEQAIRVDGQLAGVVGVGRQMSIWVAPPYQRRGIGGRAAILALTRAFHDGGRASVRGTHLAGNHRAAALLARLGFRNAAPQALYARPEQDTRLGQAVVLSRAAFAARHGLALTTRRLRLDAPRPADLPALRAIATHSAVAPCLFLFHADMEDHAFAALFPAQTLSPPFRLVARHQGRVVGSIGLDAGTAPAIYYFLTPDLAGQGLASEMVTAFVAEAAARFPLTILKAEVFADNPASRRVLEKAGFAVTGEVLLSSRARSAPAPGWLMERPV